jgi:ABC-type lipoprotein export system ATPase subunit
MTAMDPQPIIEFCDFTFQYYSQAEPTLHNINLKIYPGEKILIVGPSGSGKSTLLNILGALDEPSSGTVLVNGQDMAKIHNKDHFRARTVGFVFQLHNLIPTLNARENVEVPMMGFLSGSARRRRAEELLALVGLSDRMHHLPGQLSGGQRQRVAVARSLSNDPPLVLADEPTGSLDTASGMDLMKLMRELNRTQQKTFLIVTHDPGVARQTDRILVMLDGKIIREDRVGTEIEEDLKTWQHSRLGQQILTGELADVQDLDLDEAQIKAVRALLDRSGEG